MAKTTVDVDPELLAAAKVRLRTSTIKDTINAALREVAERGEREEAIDEVAAMIKSGDLDWSALDDKRKYRNPTDAALSETPGSISVVGVDTADVTDFPPSDYGAVEVKGVSRVPEYYTPSRHVALVASMLGRLPAAEVLSAAKDLSEPALGSGALLLQSVQRMSERRVTVGDIHGLRESVQRLLIHYSPLGAHPNDDAEATLKSVDAVLKDLEVVTGSAGEAVE